MESSNVLDLSGADLSGFDAVPSAWYDANVFEVTAAEVENDTGKLPVGTKGLSVRFKLDGGEHDGKSVWNRYWFAPAEYETKAQLDGILARFLLAIGYTEEEVKSGNFSIVPEEIEGRPCSINVKKYTYDGLDRNRVTGIRPRGQEVTQEGAGLL
jgi:hypothetical protein